MKIINMIKLSDCPDSNRGMHYETRWRDRMKLLFFDRSGFVMVLKRLTEDRFRWPRRETAVVTLSTEQLHWILDSIDIDAMVRHPVRQYQIAG
ncbi:hypothetical protein CN137_33725 [Sinorhizobium meliloti]|nr:hypothetical protein CN137_33725 [Sinorhizobium meliloti]